MYRYHKPVKLKVFTRVEQFISNEHSDLTADVSVPKVSRKSSTLWAKFLGPPHKMVTVPARMYFIIIYDTIR